MPTISFYKIVRPFETRVVLPPRIAPQSTGTGSTSNTIITVGAGSPQVLTGEYSISVKKYMTAKHKEKGQG